MEKMKENALFKPISHPLAQRKIEKKKKKKIQNGENQRLKQLPLSPSKKFFSTWLLHSYKTFILCTQVNKTSIEYGTITIISISSSKSMQQELRGQVRCLFYFSKCVYDYMLKLGVALKLHSERNILKVNFFNI